jgi:putative ABC transport system permease protein
MIQFLLKGLLRDKSRSRMPIAVVATGVMLSVFMHAYVTGIMNDTIEMNARFSNGHLKVVTRAYAENIEQMPNDLALLETGNLIGELNTNFPDVNWVERIHFGGLIDAPDSLGETKSQGPAGGLAVDLLSGKNGEAERLNLAGSLVRGNMPLQFNDVLLSEVFSQKLKVNPGDTITFIGSTMNGGMAYFNFVVSGTISFGAMALDRGTIIADIEAVRLALDMDDAAGEIAGFLPNGYYSGKDARLIQQIFNNKSVDESDEYAPKMLTLEDQGSMATFVEMANSMGAIITGVFMLAMSLVLWNAGLLGGLRRYGEVGIRLAMGEEKKHVFSTMIYESIMIGVAGSIIGTMLGLIFAWLLQTYGIDISSTMKGASVLMPTVIRARIAFVDFYIGFIPGVLSTVIGTALAGIGIFKRQTAQLFKELEV